MPIISITLLPGYGPDVEARIVQRLALAARSVVAAPAAGTTVFVQHASTYLRDGRVFEGGNAAVPDGAEVVRRFLGFMEDRQLDAARALLAPGFAMQFPGSPPLQRLEEVVERARLRYREVAKDIERIDQAWGDGHTVVYCSGTLHGSWNDGAPFAGIRFIDRFEVEGGLIRRQDVWNDMALATR